MALVSIFRPTSHLPSQLCSPRCVAFWMAHLALSVALATMVLAMSSTMVAMATGRRWGVGLGSSETHQSININYHCSSDSWCSFTYSSTCGGSSGSKRPSGRLPRCHGR